MKALLEAAMITGVLALACLLAEPAHPDELTPDAVLAAQTLTGESRTLQATSWQITTVVGRDLWFDLFGADSALGCDLADAGAGLSIDVLPDANYCVGGGWYADAWFGYAGVHVALW